MLKTNNASLQKQLEDWVIMLEMCTSSEISQTQKRDCLKAFAQTFVPPDVRAVPEDFDYFLNNLINDEEYLQGVKRDIGQCASGVYVESIQPSTQIKKALFILLPPPELSKYFSLLHNLLLQ